jgi:non-specific serine/threonine protein kinase/serine/threonine-protein kinase
MNERSIFMEALDFDEPRERSAYIERACGGDERLRARVEALLRRHHGDDKLVLDRMPAVEPSVTEDLSSLVEEPGTSIGPYKLREQIGEGGMGIVYVAEQTQPVRRHVALKIIRPGMDSRQVIARFEAERQALAMMDHLNIARVFDGGTTPSGRPYFVMELVRGIPITEYCDAQKLTIRERLDLFVLVCRAVQHAHQKGIIHRDLKPSNILITLHDGVPVPKVIDFGVAKATGQSLTDKTVYTAFTQLVGTPLYMSPEQVELSGLDIDTRSDIYSLGVLLYELMTGTTPFDADTLRNAAFDEMRRIIREQEPQSPSVRLSSLGETLPTVSARRGVDARRLGPSLRGELDWIVMKALEKDRRRRYETANDFAADVMRYLTDQPVQACSPSAGYRLRKFVRRNKGPVAVGLALATLLVLGTVGTSIGLVWALRAERKATQEKERATAAETEAKEEAAAASAVRDFLTGDVIGQAAPDKNTGNKKLTVEEAAGRAAARIADKFAHQPRLEAEIRLTVGQIYAVLGDNTAAQPHMERALEISSRVLGEGHPKTLRFMSSLGGLYMDLGKLGQAEALLVQARKGLRIALGESHPDTRTAMLRLGLVHIYQGKLGQAETLFVQLQGGRPLVQGGDQPDTGAMTNLAGIYMKQGRLAQAEELLAKALEEHRRTLGEHRTLLIIINNLADVYMRQGKRAQAEQLFLEAIRVSRHDLGEEHPVTLRATVNLANLYERAGRIPEYANLIEQAWKAQKKPGSPDIEHIVIQVWYAGILLERQRFAEAEPLLRECLRWREQNEPDDWRTFNTKSWLGGSLLGQKKFAEAEPLLLAGYEGMKQRAAYPPRLAEAVERLAQFYEVTGKKEKAAEWRAKLPARKAPEVKKN